MANGHVDVNLPRSSWHRAATFLADFARWLQAEGFSTWTVRKEPGNHLTAFWLYARLDDTLPAKSRIQFGCTKFAEVNPSVHAYARGKAEHLSSAVALLQKFVREVWAALGMLAGDEEQDEPMPDGGHENWRALSMEAWRCPSSQRMWFSCAEDETFSFMPAQSGCASICGHWRAYQDDVTAIWCCRESSRHLFVRAGA